jgi:hypothetical protein
MTHLVCLVVGGITPVNISEIPADRILDFKTKRTDEIANFRKCLSDLHDELRVIDANEIKIDAIRDKVKALNQAKVDYRNSADLIQVKGWTGTKMLGFPAVIELAKIMGIPLASMIPIDTTALEFAGIALGALFTIKSNSQDLKKLNKENPASFLIEMQRSFKGYTKQRGGGDINYHAWNCMEEFIND